MSEKCQQGSRNERTEAAGAIAEAVIRSVELIVQPTCTLGGKRPCLEMIVQVDAHDVVLAPFHGQWSLFGSGPF